MERWGKAMRAQKRSRLDVVLATMTTSSLTPWSGDWQLWIVVFATRTQLWLLRCSSGGGLAVLTPHLHSFPELCGQSNGLGCVYNSPRLKLMPVNQCAPCQEGWRPVLGSQLPVTVPWGRAQNHSCEHTANSLTWPPCAPGRQLLSWMSQHPMI